MGDGGLGEVECAGEPPWVTEGGKVVGDEREVKVKKENETMLKIKSSRPHTLTSPPHSLKIHIMKNHKKIIAACFMYNTQKIT
jgi:hypothetical protein